MIRCFDLPLATGVTLACRAAGSGRVRVMLLHGFPEAAFVWDDVMARVAAHAACVAPNLRGYAGSSAPADRGAYRVQALVGDIAAAIDATGAPIDVLVAHDWGGALAWGLAAARPDLLRRLLIVNSPHPAAFLRELRTNPAQQRASAYMNFLCRDDAAALLAERDFARLWAVFGDAPAWMTPALRDAYHAAWTQGLEGPLNYYRASPLRPATDAGSALHRVELSDAAVSVRVPTTVLWGDGDRALLPALLDGLGRWVPTLSVVRLPEASHWVIHEQPARVADEIVALLGTQAS